MPTPRHAALVLGGVYGWSVRLDGQRMARNMGAESQEGTGQMTERKITNVYNWANGMTMVFDQYGQQMPEFQGRTEEVIPKIRAAGFGETVPTSQWPRGSFNDAGS